MCPYSVGWLGCEACSVVQSSAIGEVVVAFCHRGKCFVEECSGKYWSDWGRWCSKEGRGGYNVSLWKIIYLF